MKSKLAALCLLVLALAAPARAQDFSQVPEIVTLGLRSYVVYGPKEAMDVWFKYSAFEYNEAARAQLLAGLTRLTPAYGRVLGWEPVRYVPLSPSACRVYVLIKYERGPVWMSLDCFRAIERWFVYGMDYNTDPTKIQPLVFFETTAKFDK